MQTSSMVDISGCNSEPIHLIGQTQAYGTLLVLDGAGVIVKASSNTAQVLGLAPDRLLGRPITAVLAWSPLRLQPGEQQMLIDLELLAGLRFDVLALEAQGGMLIEIEPHQHAKRPLEDSFAQLHRAVRRLHDTRNLPNLLDALVAEVRLFSGFDRVMVYRFDEAWNGSVVAESRTDAMRSYLGQKFPADDIPAPARAVFSRTWLRIIPDASAPSHPLLPHGTAIDLSASSLRAPAPVHLVYLHNMHVAASMTLTLKSAGKLWGLVACHHADRRHVSLTQRQEAELLARVTSSLLQSKQDEGETYSRRRLQTAVGAWTARARRRLPDGLREGEPSLLELGAPRTTGAIACYDQRLVGIGRIPPDSFCRALLAWLTEQHGEAQMVEHDALASVFAPATEHQETAAGMLGIQIGHGHGNWVVWFRPEAVHTIDWAGNPDEKVEAPGATSTLGAPQLMPRTSFALWRQTVRHRAEPFDAVSKEAGVQLRKGLTEVALDEELRRQEITLQRVVRQRQRMTFLAQAARLLGQSLARDELLDKLIPLILRTLGPWLVLELISERGWQLYRRAQRDGKQEALPVDAPLHPSSLLAPLCHPDAPRAALWREQGLLRAALERHRLGEVLGAPHDLRAALITPITILGEVRGHLAVGRVAGEAPFGRNDLDVVAQLAQMLGQALGNAQLYRDAQEATRGRDHVLGVVSHDLRNPLGVIRLSSELLQRRSQSVAEELRPKLTAPIGRIDSACERMQRLIDDVLSLAKVEGGGLLIDPQPTRADALIDEAFSMFEPLAQAQQVQLECTEPPDDAMLLHCDFERMMQVLGNLIGNAIKFTPAGGRVRLVSARQNDEAWIAVVDDGPGIAPHEVPHVFDRFWQARHSARKGAGLGLAIAKGIVEAHGGRIGVERSSANGSTFAFTCPLAAPGAQPSAPP